GYNLTKWPTFTVCPAANVNNQPCDYYGGAEIQTAVNACPTQGCTILLAEGNYTVTSSILIQNRRSITIQGEGSNINWNIPGQPGGSAILCSLTSACVDYDGSIGPSLQGMRLAYLSIIASGSGVSSSSARAIYTDNFYSSDFDHIQISNFQKGYGIYMNPASGVRYTGGINIYNLAVDNTAYPIYISPRNEAVNVFGAYIIGNTYGDIGLDVEGNTDPDHFYGLTFLNFDNGLANNIAVKVNGLFNEFYGVTIDNAAGSGTSTGFYFTSSAKQNMVLGLEVSISTGLTPVNDACECNSVWKGMNAKTIIGTQQTTSSITASVLSGSSTWLITSGSPVLLIFTGSLTGNVSDIQAKFIMQAPGSTQIGSWTITTGTGYCCGVSPSATVTVMGIANPSGSNPTNMTAQMKWYVGASNQQIIIDNWTFMLMEIPYY
ncbi:MAG: hypothetical protein WB643_06715, partial [Candidatus Bathyarchaeia archaeon]